MKKFLILAFLFTLIHGCKKKSQDQSISDNLPNILIAISDDHSFPDGCVVAKGEQYRRCGGNGCWLPYLVDFTVCRAGAASGLDWYGRVPHHHYRGIPANAEVRPAQAGARYRWKRR